MRPINRKLFQKIRHKVEQRTIAGIMVLLFLLFQMTAAPGVSLAGQIFTRPSGSNEPFKPVPMIDPNAPVQGTVGGSNQTPSGSALPANDQPLQPSTNTQVTSTGSTITTKSSSTPIPSANSNNNSSPTA